MTALCYNILLLKKNSIDEIKRRKGLNRIIMEELKKIRESAEAATKSAQLAVLKCKEAEEKTKRFLKIEEKNQNIFEQSILDEIEEINKEIEKENAGLEKIQKNYLHIESNLSVSYEKSFNFMQNSVKRINAKIFKIQGLKSRKDSLKILIDRNKKLNQQFISKLNTPYYPLLNDANKVSPSMKDLVVETDEKNLSALNVCYRPENKILVCASSNTAVTLLADRISKIEPGLVHVYARCKEKEKENPNDKLSLHFRVKEMLKNNEVYQELKKNFKSKKEPNRKKAAKAAV